MAERWRFAEPTAWTSRPRWCGPEWRWHSCATAGITWRSRIKRELKDSACMRTDAKSPGTGELCHAVRKMRTAAYDMLLPGSNRPVPRGVGGRSVMGGQKLFRECFEAEKLERIHDARKLLCQAMKGLNDLLSGQGAIKGKGHLGESGLNSNGGNAPISGP
jgi:hypothetical protein